MKYERFCETYSSKNIVSYKWTFHAENHKSQIKAIIKYLNTHFKLILPDEIVTRN
jgi:hypothetical protein